LFRIIIDHIRNKGLHEAQAFPGWKKVIPLKQRCKRHIDYEKNSYHEVTLSDDIAQAVDVNWEGITRGSRSCKKFWHRIIPTPWRKLRWWAILGIIMTGEAKVN
jgi:hypothetical protein